MADIDKEITVKVKAEDDTAKATQSAKQRLRDLQKQMLELEQAGQKNTDQFRKMAAEAGSLKDAIGDTSAQVKALASDTRALDTFTSAIQGIAGGFAVAQSAAALFGEENEDVQKAMMKVQAALALVNGATAVANTLNKDSALMVNLNAAAQRAYALSVGTSTGALKLFRLALVATGIGAAVVALGLLIANFDKLTAAVKKFIGIPVKENLDGQIKSMERMAELAKERGATEAQQFAIEFDISRKRLANAKNEEEADEARHQHNILRAQYEAFLKQQESDRLEKAAQARKEELRKIKEHNEQVKKMREQAKEDTPLGMTPIDGVQKHMDKLAETVTLGETKLLGAKRIGVKERLALDEQERQRQAMLEQAKIDTATKTFQALGNVTMLFAGKTEKSQRRAFEINKKMSMAQTLIETYSAAQGAYRSQMSIPDPSAPIRATIAAAAAVAAGLLRVQQISKQTFQSPSAGTGGGSSGSSAPPTTGGFAPGAMNPNSQLLNPNEGAGQGQGQGMRAYVVESDVRTVAGRLRRISEFAQLAN
jgi:hypothetical protein